MNGYEPLELGGVYMWLIGGAPWCLPFELFARLTGGELNERLGWRSYGERSEALADLGQSLRDADGNCVGGAV